MFCRPQSVNRARRSPCANLPTVYNEFRNRKKKVRINHPGLCTLSRNLPYAPTMSHQPITHITEPSLRSPSHLPTNSDSSARSRWTCSIPPSSSPDPNRLTLYPPLPIPSHPISTKALRVHTIPPAIPHSSSSIASFCMSSPLQTGSRPYLSTPGFLLSAFSVRYGAL